MSKKRKKQAKMSKNRKEEGEVMFCKIPKGDPSGNSGKTSKKRKKCGKGRRINERTNGIS